MSHPLDQQCPRYARAARAITPLALALALVACSGGDDGNGTSPQDTGQSDADVGIEDGGDGDTSPSDTAPDAPDTGDDAGSEDVAEDVPPPPPEEIICTPCSAEADCLGDFNFCITLPSGEDVCGVDCTDDEESCPEGTFCALLDEARGISQCVPESLFCEDPCVDVTCDEGEICDPFQEGECVEPLGYCDECLGDSQCGGESDRCLVFPDVDNRAGCTIDCSEDESVCPEGSFCAFIDEARTIQQCVPEILTCVDRCEGVTCEEEGESCEPRTGECTLPGGLCEPCATDRECGGEQDRCLGFPGPDGTTEAFCTTDCSEDPFSCPEDFFCADVNTSAGPIQQCVPSILTCVDRCADVTCGADENCDPTTGECLESILELCDPECTNSAECGGPDDLCLNFSDTESTCARACGEDHPPCPIGYQCISITSGGQQCVPQTFECTGCDGISCPEGETCHPLTGDCLPPPAGCSSADTTCPAGSVCNTRDERCEPVGAPCDYETRFSLCDFSTQICTAARPGQSGSCQPRCTGAESCPASRPECGSFYGVIGSVCSPRTTPAGDVCGRLMPTSSALGRPCSEEDIADGRTPCFGSATFCADGLDDSIPGFCTRECTSDADCTEDDATCEETELGSLCVPSLCSCLNEPALEEGETDLLGAALEAFDLTRCDFLFLREQRRSVLGSSALQDAYRLADAFAATAEPTRLPSLLAAERAAVGATGEDAETPEIAALRLAAAARGLTIDETLGPVELPDDPTMFDAIDELYRSAGSPPPDDVAGRIDDEVPAALQDALTPLIRMLTTTLNEYSLALGSVDPDLRDAITSTLHATLYAGETELDLRDPAVEELLSRGLDMDLLATIAFQLSRTIDELPTALTGVDAVDFRLETPYGDIVLSGSGDDEHLLTDPVLLLVDTGGDDIYEGPVGANGGFETPISVAIDLGGADSYGYAVGSDDGPEGLLPADEAGRAAPERGGDGAVSLSAAARQGAGTLGVGILVDRGAGRDDFASLRLSQGFGMAGVGILVDEGLDGADFAAEALSQGAGLFGIGILTSSEGNDAFTGYHGVQGFGGSFGVGVLADIGGDDVYLAEPGSLDDDTVIYSQRMRGPDVNFSAAQGAGVGFAPASDDEVGASGGFGVLIDRAGDDTYTAGVGAQGFGRWWGVGMLWDEAGSDDYDAAALAQGAGFASGAGSLEDSAGDDEYGAPEALVTAGQGFGEDFGVGVLRDRGGADFYGASQFGGGSGVLNGAGLFADDGGADMYRSDSSDSWGKSVLTILGSEPEDNPRRDAPTFGFFVDASGADTYDRPDLLSPPIGDDLSWEQVPREEEDLPVYGAGVDGEGPLILLAE